MSNATNTECLYPATTRAGQTVHWYRGEQGSASPLCGQNRRVRGSGYCRVAYGQTVNCPHCQAVTSTEPATPASVARWIMLEEAGNGAFQRATNRGWSKTAANQCRREARAACKTSDEYRAIG